MIWDQSNTHVMLQQFSAVLPSSKLELFEEPDQPCILQRYQETKSTSGEADLLPVLLIQLWPSWSISYRLTRFCWAMAWLGFIYRSLDLRRPLRCPIISCSRGLVGGLPVLEAPPRGFHPSHIALWGCAWAALCLQLLQGGVQSGEDPAKNPQHQENWNMIH